MMEVVIVSTIIFTLAVLALSLGTVLGGRQPKGQCGGSAIHEESCIKDDEGNKIQSCPQCSCESE